ncbi:type IX secretion system periplasmic lipoprotein PorW/SprE [Salegentibacter chungangensis]|uniref:Tetratricopeptide repeat protein n=1 Tax=Salegentibacter chungangensis TaxID=1335724 RepID=A0ABW3NMP6_9FLAO
MNSFTRFFILLIFAGSIFGCSRKKNTFINRNWHAVTTEYNTLYNGHLALAQGREELNQNYADNYWDLLPIERMSIDEQVTLPDSIRNQNFGKAEEKAVKAIQRHSMLIGGKERNPQIDEAYLLLGKARYFDQRFIPALDAFNYILHKYPASNNINKAQIWREKTYIRLDNNKLAKKNLKRIIDLEDLEDQDLADANAALSQAYINLEQIDSATVALQVAAESTEKSEEKGRYYFILGQLYNRLQQPDKANTAFDEVIALNRKSPRIYMINAYVQKARNFEYGAGNNYQLRELLTELEEDRENRPFLDKIYFQIGEYYSRLDSTKTAIEYYNKSLRAPSSDIYLKSINYEILADIYFDRADYRTASKYYDSTLVNMSPRLREFRTIKKKRNNLEDVIFYRGIADKNDSILNLAEMSEEDQIAYFTGYTEKLKADFEAEIEDGERKMAIAANSQKAIPDLDGAGGPSNSFYFYNPTRVSNGAREFFITWGRRQLADNWRWKDRSSGVKTQAGEESEISLNLDEDPRFDPMSYVSLVPTDKTELDSINNERNYAYYQLGLIYKEKFGEYEMATQRLEDLLEYAPEERLILPARYNLYEIYRHTGQNSKASAMEQVILNEYPDSRYAAYIRNPQEAIADEDSPEKKYDAVFEKFEKGEYREVVEESDKFISNYTGDEIVPKFELLKAMATGRLMGIEAYKSALNYVALTYPQSPEGKRAQQIYNQAIPQLSNMQFNTDSLQTNYKLVYRFKAEEAEPRTALKTKIEKAIGELEYEKLSVSEDVYSPEEQFIVIHGLKDKASALGFAELLAINDNYKVKAEPVVISTENYRIIQIQKNLDRYLSSL